MNKNNFIINFTKPTPQDDALKGLWFRYEPGGLGEPVRFYYFHGNGNGLYRYGRIGYTNTNSYDYQVDGNTVTLEFRKTGVEHKTSFRIESKGSQEWLILEDDPKEPGARYFKERQQMSLPHTTDESVTHFNFHLFQSEKQEIGAFTNYQSGVGAARALQAAIAESGLRPDEAPAIVNYPFATIQSLSGYMWIEVAEYKTGGEGFAIYQFREAGIDGRGTGWFHQGDFNDWSTESFQYRMYQDHLELAFELRPENCTTKFSITTKDKKRSLHLDKDPRNFWHRRCFQEMGKSF